MSVYAQNTIEDKFCDVSTGMRLCYRTYGPDDGEPLLLIVGLGLQLTAWPISLINNLIQCGYKVIIFDNRDVGRSSRVSQRPPNLLRQLIRRPESSAYDLQDMAQDVIGLLDHLCVTRAHVVGMSMGGMIAQVIAAQHPQRIKSLTSIFSTTGALNVGQPALSSLLMLVKSPARNCDEAVARHVQLVRHIGSTKYAISEQSLSDYAAHAWNRGEGGQAHEGMARQIGAIMQSGDRTAELNCIQVPTLVIHSDQDRMVAPSGGAATAAAIPRADFISIHGMGHFIPEGIVPVLTDLIDRHIQRSINN